MQHTSVQYDCRVLAAGSTSVPWTPHPYMCLPNWSPLPLHTHKIFTSSNFYRQNAQSWLKLQAPLEFFQKMHNFSQKIVTIANVLVYTYLFSVCATTPKKARGQKKNHIWHHFTQKMGQTKLFAPFQNYGQIVLFQAYDSHFNSYR